MDEKLSVVRKEIFNAYCSLLRISKIDYMELLTDDDEVLINEVYAKIDTLRGLNSLLDEILEGKTD